MKPDLKLYEIQDGYGECISRYRTFKEAMDGFDVFLKDRVVDRERLEIKIKEAKDELDILNNEDLKVVEVEATKQRLTWMENEEKDKAEEEFQMEILAYTNAEL